MQFVRRSIQALVVLVLVAIPFLYLYNVERYARQNFSYSLAGKQISDTEWFQRQILDYIDGALAKTENPDKIISAISGSPWSINILGYNISDPLAAVTLTIAGGNFYWPFLLSILPLVILSALLGRVFCGWLCPFHFLAEISNKLRRLFTKFGLKPHDIHLKRKTKFIILGALAGFSFVAGVSIFPHIYPPAVISREVFNSIFYGTVGFGFFFIIFLLFTELTLSERWWCRYACPGGAIYALLGSVRILRMVRIEDRCTLCVECDDACPFGLLPMSDKTGMECDNCGLCKKVCPEAALEYRFMTYRGEKKLIAEHSSNRKKKTRQVRGA